MKMIDTHAHLNDNRFAEDLDDVLQRAQAAGVTAIINVGYDLSSSQQAAAMALANPLLYAAVGIHPHDGKAASDDVLAKVQELAQNKKVVALGEIGLDYYYDHCPHDVQRDVFRSQLHLASSLALPVIIHDRDAHGDVLAILQEEQSALCAGVMHCFSGDVKLAGKCLDLGLHISLAGPVTFKNPGGLPEVAKYVPLERLLVETDAPYLTPVPRRGRRNEPAYVRMVVDKIAEIRGEDSDYIAEITSQNAKKLFNLE